MVGRFLGKLFEDLYIYERHNAQINNFLKPSPFRENCVKQEEVKKKRKIVLKSTARFSRDGRPEDFVSINSSTVRAYIQKKTKK